MAQKHELSPEDWNLANPVEEANLLLEKLLQEKDMMKYINVAKNLFPYRNLMQKIENKKKNNSHDIIDYISVIRSIVDYCEQNKDTGLLGVGL